MITTLVFDIGGVFLHPEQTRTDALWESFGLVDPAVGDHVMYGDELWNQYKRGQMTEETYWNELITKLPVPYTEGWETLRDAFEHSVRLDTELVQIVNHLKSHYAVHALSNAGAELERRLNHFEIEGLFKEVINSHYVKLAKPDREIYQLTAERVGVAPEEILFIDDKVRNTRIAEELGFHTHVYTDANAFRAFLKVNSILKEEFPSI